jgi:hypothetical protein
VNIRYELECKYLRRKYIVHSNLPNFTYPQHLTTVGFRFFYVILCTVIKYIPLRRFYVGIDEIMKICFLIFKEAPAMLGGSLVTSAWRVLRLRMKENASRSVG